jgi:large subunit ribosomal protein L32
MRHTRGHTRNRRSHHALEATSLVSCSNCGQPGLKHVLCKNCGYFKGRLIVDKTAKIDKKVAKAQKAKA